MLKRLTIFLALLLALGSLATAAVEEPAAPPVNVILMSWDGVHQDAIQELLAPAAIGFGQRVPTRLPNLKAIGAEGRLSREVIVTHATDTKAGHTQMLTGYEPEVTGVFSNVKFEEIPTGLTIFERAKARFGDKIVTIMVKGKRNHIGIQKGLPFYNAVRPDNPLHIDWVVEPEVGGDDTAAWTGPKMLEALDKFGRRPFFAFFHFSDPDHMGHAHGEGSADYRKAILLCDTWLGKVVAKLKELGVYEKTRLYITADHGFNKGTTGHGYAPYVWLATNDPLILRGGNQRDLVPTLLRRLGIDPLSVDPPFIIGLPEKALAQ
jgi:predicted AlkP superfamily pyrophosphatase or phosphodiesterase